MAKNQCKKKSVAMQRPTRGPVSLKYYLGHLEKLRNAKAATNHSPVEFNVNNFLRVYQIPSEFRTILHNLNQNKDLLIDLIKFPMKPINPCAPEGADVQLRKTRHRVLKKYFAKVQAENHVLYQRLSAIKNPKRRRQSMQATEQSSPSSVPLSVIKRFKSVVEIPKNCTLQEKIFRPKIYFDLEAKGERALGRIIFQLYTEASPEVVLQLLRFFAMGQCEKFYFPRLYSALWVESEIQIGENVEDCDKYYDMGALDCQEQPGMLCFALQDFKLLKQGVLVFSISFRPLTVKDGKRFAFGKLIGGRSRFLCLHEYGSKSGKPLKEISVTNMGVL